MVVPLGWYYGTLNNQPHMIEFSCNRSCFVFSNLPLLFWAGEIEDSLIRGTVKFTRSQSQWNCQFQFGCSHVQPLAVWSKDYTLERLALTSPMRSSSLMWGSWWKRNDFWGLGFDMRWLVILGMDPGFFFGMFMGVSRMNRRCLLPHVPAFFSNITHSRFFRIPKSVKLPYLTCEIWMLGLPTLSLEKFQSSEHIPNLSY